MAPRSFASISAVALVCAVLIAPCPIAGQARGRAPAAAKPSGAAKPPVAAKPPAAVQTATPFPATPPTPGPPPDFKVPEPRRFTLDNGLQVALVPWGTMPKVRVTLVLRTGNGFEHADEVWLADLTGTLMREGTTTRSGAEISQQAARMGGSVGISVGADQTTIGGDVLTEFGPPMIDLVADVARNPRFPETEIPRLKANLVRSLSVALSEPQQVALEKFRAAMYPNHPYGRIFPTEAMINGYTAEQIRGFYQNTYGAGRARLYVVGRFDAPAVEASIRKAFEAWARGTPANPEPATPASSRSVYLIDRPGAVQSTVLIGVPSVDPTHNDFIATTVMDALLGGAFASRITRNIREDKGYTHSPYSELSTRYRDSYWVENADVTTAVTGASIKEILGEIDRLQSQPPAADELKGIQNYLAGSFILQNSSRAGITSQLAYMDLHGLPATYANEYMKKIYAVTPQQVSDAVRQHLQADQATIVVVGDRKVIEEQVKPFGKIVP